MYSQVGMYKRLYEEEHKLHLTYPSSVEATPGKFLFLCACVISMKIIQRGMCVSTILDNLCWNIVILNSKFK